MSACSKVSMEKKVKSPQKKTNMLLQGRGKQIIYVNSQKVFLIN